MMISLPYGGPSIWRQKTNLWKYGAAQSAYMPVHLKALWPCNSSKEQHALSFDPMHCRPGRAVKIIGMKAFDTGLSILLVYAAAASTAVAETLGPLPSGKPAGVHQAQLTQDQGMLIVGAAALLGIGIALATSNNGNSSTPTTVSTTSTVATP